MLSPRKNYYLFDASFPKLIGVCCFLPLSGLLFCQLWSIIFAFKEATATRCNSNAEPWNFLPSISEATGRLAPQKYVWRIAIALHAVPRFVIATGYYNMHRMLFNGASSVTKYRILSSVAYALHVIEILSLMGLSFVSSTEDYDIHKTCFITFMLCATLHMIVMCVLYRWGKKALHYSQTDKENFSVKCKQALFLVNIGFWTIAVYFFYRHNEYCEDGVYSLFALCEIAVVVSNIGFHWTAVIDFHYSHLVLLDATSYG